jgi:hypothetical protein
MGEAWEAASGGSAAEAALCVPVTAPPLTLYAVGLGQLSRVLQCVRGDVVKGSALGQAQVHVSTGQRVDVEPVVGGAGGWMGVFVRGGAAGTA